MLVLAEIEVIFFTVAGVRPFWICTMHRVDNTEMSLLLLGRSCTEKRPFLLFVLRADEEVVGVWEVGRKYS